MTDPTGTFTISQRDLREAAFHCGIQFDLILPHDPAKYCMTQIGAWTLMLCLNSKDRAASQKEIINLIQGIVQETLVQVDKEIAQTELAEGATKQ